MPKPFFSIVIPTLNEEKYLPYLLKDLQQQTYTDFEVIHVDGQSDDKTVSKSQSFANKLNLTVIISNMRNVSHQRNLGGKKAKGEWILFMDADNRLPPYFLDGVRYKLAKHPQTGVFTTWLKVDSKDPLDKTFEKSLNFAIELFKVLQRPQGFGALIGCHEQVLAKVQFDVKQKFLEDGFFLHEAHRKGFRFDVFREPHFVLSLRRFRKEGTLKMIRSAAILQFKFFAGQDFYNEKMYPMLGGSYYDEAMKKQSLFKQMHTFILTSSKKQRQQAKELFDSFKDATF